MTATTRLQLIFVLLQLGDLITTLVALRMGGYESNPLVSHFMVGGSLLGLLYAKVIVLAIATGAVMARKFRAIRVVNVFYSAVVAWNTLVLVTAASQRAGH